MNKYLNFEQGEISIYLAGDALANLRCSLEQAEAIRRHSRRGAVLYVNTSFTARTFRSAWREIIGYQDGALDSRLRGNDKEGCGNDNSRKIYSLDCPIGELLWQFEDMKKMISKFNIRQIIINNWEYAFKNYQNKEEAIFRLHEFLNYEVSLLVYAQANPEKAKAGKIMRGGLGKLSGLALSIFDLTKVEQALLPVPEVAQDAPGTDKSVRPTPENVNLVASNINDLDDAQHTPLQQEKEETGAGDFSVNETGLVSHNSNTKHLPMSNKNRKLLAEYEKLYGKAQIPGESYRDMFDRVVRKMIEEKAGAREMAEA